MPFFHPPPKDLASFFLQEFKASADLQITRDMYEDALRDLQEEQVVNKLLSLQQCSLQDHIFHHFAPSSLNNHSHQVILRNRNNVRILTPAAGGD